MDGEWDIIETDVAEREDGGVSETGVEPERLNNYQILELLGKGSYGSVRKCSRMVGDETKFFAMKIIDKKRISRKVSFIRECDGVLVHCNGLDLIATEISIMRQLYHPNIVLLYEVIDDPSDYAINMVMEYLDRGQSMSYDSENKRFYWSDYTRGVSTGSGYEMEPFIPEIVVFQWIKGLLEAINYIHYRGICHRDIKPENLLISRDGNIRLSDFGCAVKFDTAKNPTGSVVETVGTTAFWGPECLSHTEPLAPRNELLGDDDMPPLMPSVMQDSTGRMAKDGRDDDLLQLFPSVTQPLESNNGTDDVFEDDLPPVMPSLIIESNTSSKSNNITIGSKNFDANSDLCFSAYTMDCWAVGVTIYAFVYGALPFPVNETGSLLDAYELILHHEPALTRPDNAEIDYDDLDTVNELIFGFLKKNPEIRLTIPSAIRLIN